MAWEVRHGRIYYYRKCRRGGRVVSQYVGNCQTAEESAQSDRDKQLSMQEAFASRQALKQIDQLLLDSEERLRQQAQAMLRELGFHQHKGTWRKQRGSKP